MFYCETCRIEAQWPKSLRGREDSYGSCEMCGKTRPCYDVPSFALPLPKKGPSDRRRAVNATKAKRSSSGSDKPKK